MKLLIEYYSINRLKELSESLIWVSLPCKEVRIIDAHLRELIISA